MTHRTIAVIGHVDHGKTSLVKALTGIETDTLKEEQARGLSIALGFASRAAPGGQLHFIDAPGHADFLRTTASGMSGADAVLLVISAVDGIQPQTLEHLKLANLFGVRHVIIALSKSDLVSGDAKAAQSELVMQLLTSFAFETSSITPCSSKTGSGMDDLIEKLETVIDWPMTRERPGDVYLPIDRVFSSPGAGTIVTGTLVGGVLTLDAAISLNPSGQTISVRGLQIDSQDVASASSGARVAVNLRNVDAKSIKKGQVLCAANAFQDSDRFDVYLEDQTSGLKHMQHVMVLIGTSAVPARLRLYVSHSTSEPAFAQIEFKSPQVAFSGQRFVIRNPASAETLTGGAILDPNARLLTRHKAEHISVLEVTLAGEPMAIADALALRDQGSFDLATLARLSRQPVDELAAILGEAFEASSDGLAFPSADVSSLQKKYIETLTELHAAHPCRPLISADQIHAALRPASAPLITWVETQLRDDSRIRQDDRGVALVSHDPLAAMSPDQVAAYRAAETRLLEIALHSAPVFDPEPQTPEQDDLLYLLVWTGRAIQFYNHSLKQRFMLHIDAVAAAHETLVKTFPGEMSFTTGDARAALATNRKTIVPLLEHFDRIGATTRNGDLRHIAQQGMADEPCAPVSSS